MSNTSVQGDTSLSSVTLIAVAVPLALLMWAIATLLFFGLPDYYRQKPGGVPSFYKALCRKHLVQVSNIQVPAKHLL
jgi:alpha-1,3-glucan synthase